MTGHVKAFVRHSLAAFFTAVSVAGCHSDSPAPEPIDVANQTLEGDFRLYTCAAVGNQGAPPCGYAGSPNFSRSVDSAHIQFNADRTAQWTMWKRSWAYPCTDPNNPVCKIPDSTWSTVSVSGTYMVASESTLTVSFPGPTGQLDPNNLAAALEFWPRLTLANQNLWKPDTLLSHTYGQFIGTHSYKRVP